MNLDEILSQAHVLIKARMEDDTAHAAQARAEREYRNHYTDRFGADNAPVVVRYKRVTRDGRVESRQVAFGSRKGAMQWARKHDMTDTIEVIPALLA